MVTYNISNTEETDENIVKRVKAGEKEAFGILIDRYEKKLRRYIDKFLKRKEDKVDIVQDVFIKAYTMIQGFDTDQKFSPWIYRIAHNEALNFIKKKRSLSFSIFSPEYIINYFKDSTNLEKDFDKKKIKIEIEKVLDDIEYHHREILLLFFYEELSYKEISEILKIPISSVGVKIQRAKIVVEKILKEKI